MPLDDIRRFRQLGSRCPGHPEHGHTSGVETTTGPLGQGIGNSVGMAIASRWLAARYNRPGFDLFDFNVYALCSDGDLMEGVGGEAASIAGHLKLSNLCWIYDDNTSPSRATRRWPSARTWPALRRLRLERGEGRRRQRPGRPSRAIGSFQQTDDRPTLIIVRSVIAWGAPHKHNTDEAHGAPLGEEEIRLTKAVYGWPQDEKFLVPEEVRRHFRESSAPGG